MIASETRVLESTASADAALQRVPSARYATLAVLLLLYVGVPLVASAYQIYVVDTILIACVGALGLNLLTGVTGQISIGQGGFLGIGAFTSALLVTRAGVPFWLSVPAAGAITALVGLLFGLPSVRIKGLYLAIATLAAQVIIEWVLSRPAVAGTGSVAAPRPNGFADDRRYYFVLLSVAVVAVIFAENVLRTRIGRALVAVRDRDIAASVLGVDVARYKLLAFGLSSFYAGIAGALLGHLGRSVNFEQFQLGLSIQYLAMIVIGGLGSVPGTLLGAAGITLLPILLRNAVNAFKDVVPGNSAVLVSSAEFFLFGLVIVVFMVVEPRAWRASRATSRTASSYKEDVSDAQQRQTITTPAAGAGSATRLAGCSCARPGSGRGLGRMRGRARRLATNRVFTGCRGTTPDGGWPPVVRQGHRSGAQP